MFKWLLLLLLLSLDNWDLWLEVKLLRNVRAILQTHNNDDIRSSLTTLPPRQHLAIFFLYTRSTRSSVLLRSSSFATVSPLIFLDSFTSYLFIFTFFLNEVLKSEPNFFKLKFSPKIEVMVLCSWIRKSFRENWRRHKRSTRKTEQHFLRSWNFSNSLNLPNRKVK